MRRPFFPLLLLFVFASCGGLKHVHEYHVVEESFSQDNVVVRFMLERDGYEFHATCRWASDNFCNNIELGKWYTKAPKDDLNPAAMFVMLNHAWLKIDNARLRNWQPE